MKNVTLQTAVKINALMTDPFWLFVITSQQDFLRSVSDIRGVITLRKNSVPFSMIC